MISRLLAAGTLTAKVQRPNYTDLIYKGGWAVASVVGANYDVRYHSPEGHEHLARAFPAGQEQQLEAYTGAGR
jgi:hypothetical protein